MSFLRKVFPWVLAAIATAWSMTATAQCPAALPVAGGSLPGPLPLFPRDNWWNADLSLAPVDPGSAGFIAFINNGGTRRLHPDFGGEASTGSVAIYGMPYAIVDGSQPKQAVTFDYWDESDGVNMATGQGVPFYPIPPQAITQPHWIEGGAPGNLDQRAQGDRHLLIVDCTNRYLYELYNVFYDAAKAKWFAGSGAFFDMNANTRRPDTWTSADAAGLAIFPGLVRYDEAFDPAVSDVGHAFRVTVRSTNGYVYPASHRAGSTAGALPMGARLRLRTNVGGQDPALRSSDPGVQKIFRAMQKYGLIVADNGSDMYITGTFDTRWNNGLLNPAFAALTASDFEVVRLGWIPSAAPPPPPAAALSAIGASPNVVVGGSGATGTVTLTAAAPAGGASVALSSASVAITVPASVLVANGSTAATFAITTHAVTMPTASTLTATYSGVAKTTTFTVNPPLPPLPVAAVLATLVLSPTSVTGGLAINGSVTLSAPAPAGGAIIALASSNAAAASTPSTLTIAAGATQGVFVVATRPTRRNTTATITASFAGVTKAVTISIRAR